MAIIIVHGPKPGQENLPEREQETACGKKRYYEVMYRLARMRLIGYSVKNGDDVRKYLRPAEDMCPECLEAFKAGL